MAPADLCVTPGSNKSSESGLRPLSGNVSIAFCWTTLPIVAFALFHSADDRYFFFERADIQRDIDSQRRSHLQRVTCRLKVLNPCRSTVIV